MAWLKRQCSNKNSSLTLGTASETLWSEFSPLFASCQRRTFFYSGFALGNLLRFLIAFKNILMVCNQVGRKFIQPFIKVFKCGWDLCISKVLCLSLPNKNTRNNVSLGNEKSRREGGGTSYELLRSSFSGSTYQLPLPHSISSIRQPL